MALSSIDQRDGYIVSPDDSRRLSAQVAKNATRRLYLAQLTLSIAYKTTLSADMSAFLHG
jgi:hypothetical protein